MGTCPACKAPRSWGNACSDGCSNIIIWVRNYVKMNGLEKAVFMASLPSDLKWKFKNALEYRKIWGLRPEPLLPSSDGRIIYS